MLIFIKHYHCLYWQSLGWATIQTLEGDAKAFIAHYNVGKPVLLATA